MIFHSSGLVFLLEYLGPWNPEVLCVEGEQLNMRVLVSSIIRKGNRVNAYIDCYIQMVRPRLVVTRIDNDLRFYSLAQRHPNIRTLFIQNGIRTYFADAFELLDLARPSEGQLKVDRMMTIGDAVGFEYRKYIEGDVLAMGSLRNNLVPKHNAKRPGIIAFNSQYRTGGFAMGGRYYSFFDFFRQADQVILPFLVQYSRKKNKTLVIVPCSGHYPDDTLKQERAYFEELLGEPCAFSEWHWHGSSYETADASEVFVSIDSTLGYESAARGNKTAIFSIRSQLLGLAGFTYGWPGRYPDEGPFWTNRPDASAFERILDHLFEIDDEQWQEELANSAFSNIMVYDPGNSILKTILEKELGPPPISGMKQYAA